MYQKIVQTIVIAVNMSDILHYVQMLYTASRFWRS